nr:NADH dehydrogenase subunit 1 [Kinixys belliana]
MKMLMSTLVAPLTYVISILIASSLLHPNWTKDTRLYTISKGPKHGLLQPAADGMKLLTKEPIYPLNSSTTLFTTSPILAMLLALSIWLPLPTPFPLADLNLGILFLMVTSSLMVYSILWSGWASNSKYALMGSPTSSSPNHLMRSNLGIILLSMVLFSGGFNMQTFMTTQEPLYLMFSSWPLMMMWYISTLAETNRAPFDLTEGESELVSGFNVEYAAGSFTLFFMAEYSNILMMNTLTTILFLNPAHINNTPEMFSASLALKTMILSSGFLWIRASYPRFRYDQLMHLLWKNFLPITLALCLWHYAYDMFRYQSPYQGYPRYHK